MITSCTSSGWMPARATASRMAMAPRSTAPTPDRLPWKPPIGVRAPLTMTISDIANYLLNMEDLVGPGAAWYSVTESPKRVTPANHS
ncbi:hypothetical protein D9M69_573000 [compost metagenome]